MSQNDPYSVDGFIDHLVNADLLLAVNAGRVRAAMRATQHPLDTVFTELGLMREEAFAQEVAKYLKTDFIEDLRADIEPELPEILGIGFLSLNSIIPLTTQHSGRVRLALADPFRTDALSMIAYQTGCAIDICLAVRSVINSALAGLGTKPETRETEDQGFVNAYGDDIERLREFAEQAPVVRFVAKVALIAFDEGATDIHFEPLEHLLRVRIRVDGDLKPVETVSAELLPGIATRIKILSSLDISERRLPQDGRMRLVVRGQDLDLRVSIVPSIHGETIVLRILDRSKVALDLSALGFELDAQRQLSRLAETPNGILLVTGPTGSGKTTTLYALIQQLNQANVKIFTVEDPVEYRLNGITQLQTNTATGLSFARALRSILRQDPDIILVGEIRDRETAEIAMQAALTGHLVLSTLHTNSAVGAITRLRDMGMENYLIGATVKGVLGQRLVRKVCTCGGGADAATCHICNGSGYRGRTVTYEIAELSPSIAAMVSSGATEEAIELDLRQGSYVPMELQAMDLAQRNITTHDEIARAVRIAAG